MSSAISANGVNATLTLTSDWGSGYCASVALANTGTSAVTSWTTVINLAGSTLASSWSATASVSGSTLTVSPAGYNATIAAGTSTSFGFCGNGTGRPTLTSITVTGGGAASGTGGAASTGGAAATGGKTSTGGTAATGGSRSSTGGATPTGGTRTTGGAAASGGSPATGGTTSSTSGACGAGDANLPAEPTIPGACATLQASQNVATNGVPAESNLDTSRIQSALNACGSGKAVRLTTGGGNNAFITGPITVPSGVTLWVDAGATLFATRDTSVWGSASALITVTGANSGIVGDGVIDGQGGEPNVGSSQSWWDQNAGSSGNSPALIQVKSATQFTLYRITLHNSPKFHVKLSAAGFVVWGVTIKSPSKATNSVGTALNYSNAHNTDGIDPGESASNGYIVCNKISTGDDHIALKGSSSTGVSQLVIAHNRFGAGHGMSIGSEFTGGVSNIKVYDLSIDGQGMGTSGGSSNGIRIKSDSSRGGLVNNVTYSDVCVRNISNPILLTPFYSSSTGSDIPQYTNITIQNFHWVTGGSNTPTVTLDGYGSSYINSVTLDNVIIDTKPSVKASYTTVTLGPGNVNFTPSGTGVTVTNKISGSSTPNPCTNKWTTF